MSDDVSARLLTKQRKRLVASIMGAAETSPWWNKLTRDEQMAFRQKVLDSVGVFSDLTMDLLRVTGEDVVVNGHALELLESVYEAVQGLRH